MHQRGSAPPLGSARKLALAVAYFFIQLSALVSVFTICRSDVPLPFRLIVGMGFAVAASYSSVQGMLVWPTLVLSLCSVMEGADKDSDLVFLKENGGAGFIGAAK